ncbi:MAG TPA: S-methyl-5-thioribose-1-phosphate isomerase [Clostridia bacterium]|nr:S-methyl-5-thioribose-1-phosphate isomerase [Clostridia bacterium]
MKASTQAETFTPDKQKRHDHDLGFLLRYENIAWYEDGMVRILDRRIYPTQVKYVECLTVGEVADAITAMVTQSAGPYTAASMGMALAAYHVRGQSKSQQMLALEQAAQQLSTARPTTESRMRRVTGGALIAAKAALDKDEHDLSQTLFEVAFDSLERRYERMSRVGEHLISLLANQATIMTNCFGETIVGTAIRAAQEKGITLKLFCPETRPYFQGARLTSSVAIDMGVDVTVITDNMPAEVLSSHHIDLFTTAADAITMDGYVVNKIGTLQIAIAAKYYGVPYFVTGIPDTLSIGEITIEQRNPEFVLEARGVRNTKPGVKGYYPAFDITPPHLVSGVVTDKGILTPYTLSDYSHSDHGEDEYYGGLII